jgi:hypothetical protein
VIFAGGTLVTTEEASLFFFRRVAPSPSHRFAASHSAFAALAALALTS